MTPRSVGSYRRHSKIIIISSCWLLRMGIIISSARPLVEVCRLSTHSIQNQVHWSRFIRLNVSAGSQKRVPRTGREKELRFALRVYFVTIWTNTVTIRTNNLSGPSDVVSKATRWELNPPKCCVVNHKLFIYYSRSGLRRAGVYSCWGHVLYHVAEWIFRTTAPGFWCRIINPSASQRCYVKQH